MYKRRHNKSLKKSWPFLALVITGAGLNLIAVLTDDNGALVAVGCSLIAIGASLKVKAAKRNTK